MSLRKLITCDALPNYHIGLQKRFYINVVLGGLRGKKAVRDYEIS
jgi:hypothetical protein